MVERRRRRRRRRRPRRPRRRAPRPSRRRPPPPPPKKVITLKGVQMKSATKIDMPGDIEYQSGSAKIVLNDKSKKVLTQLATILKDNAEITKLRIEGNTDNAGEDKGFDNVKLSQQRAQSIADYLTKSGVDASRLVVVGLRIVASARSERHEGAHGAQPLHRLRRAGVQRRSGGGLRPPAGAVSAAARQLGLGQDRQGAARRPRSARAQPPKAAAPASSH